MIHHLLKSILDIHIDIVIYLSNSKFARSSIKNLFDNEISLYCYSIIKKLIYLCIQFLFLLNTQTTTLDCSFNSLQKIVIW